MIEAPEALFLSEQLGKNIIGKVIIDVIARHTPHKFAFFNGNPEIDYSTLLSGKTINQVNAHGGMVDIMAEDIHLVFTDGANICLYNGNEKIPVKHQLMVIFDDNSCLTVSIRMYGGLLCFRENHFDAPIAEYYYSARSKPQVMTNDFSLDYFMELANNEFAQNKSVKALLATEQNIPGLGNGVLQDILFNAKIHPKTKTGTLTNQQKTNLYHCIKSTLTAIYHSNGRNTETDLFGKPGMYVPILSNKKAGKECPKCGGIIKKENYLGGSIYFCRNCQDYS